MRLWLGVIATVCLGLTGVVSAQKNELAAEASGFVNTSPYDPSAGAGLQLNYARKLVGVPLISLYVEVPFVAGFNNEQFVVTQLQRENYNNYYVTPGLKVKFAPGFFVSPYLAAGVGWAHFSSTSNNTSDTNFAADWGGGLDFKIAPVVGLRVEARDFYSGVPSLVPLLPSLGNQNNIVVSGGLWFRF